MRIFGQLLLVDKQKVPYLYKTTSKEFEFLKLESKFLKLRKGDYS